MAADVCVGMNAYQKLLEKISYSTSWCRITIKIHKIILLNSLGIGLAYALRNLKLCCNKKTISEIKFDKYNISVLKHFNTLE